MGEWNLAIAVIGAVAVVIGLGLTLARDLTTHVDRRFGEAERLRLEASATWKERLKLRDETIERLVHGLDQAMQEHNELLRMLSDQRAEAHKTFVTQDTFFAEAGRNLIKLDKILERLPPRVDPYG